jgi:hypothetical protein
MHRALLKVACLLMLAACSPVKVPSADAAASDPNRSRELMRQCKVEWAKVGDATCTAFTEAWRRRVLQDRNPNAGPAFARAQASTKSGD